MIGRGVAALAFGLMVVPMIASAQGIGACSWAKAAGGERAAFLAAYQQNLGAGTTQLGSVNDQLHRYAAECARRTDLPAPWVEGAIASVAIQDGAATALNATLKIARPALDAAWTEAPAAARDCARANAAKSFGINDLTCPDPKAPLWFLQRFGIAPATDRADATQALYYFNAKAQEEWAESLIARFMQKPAAS
jgi:hypothetical protein